MLRLSPQMVASSLTVELWGLSAIALISAAARSTDWIVFARDSVVLIGAPRLPWAPGRRPRGGTEPRLRAARRRAPRRSGGRPRRRSRSCRARTRRRSRSRRVRGRARRWAAALEHDAAQPNAETAFVSVDCARFEAEQLDAELFGAPPVSRNGDPPARGTRAFDVAYPHRASSPREERKTFRGCGAWAHKTRS